MATMPTFRIARPPRRCAGKPGPLLDLSYNSVLPKNPGSLNPEFCVSLLTLIATAPDRVSAFKAYHPKRMSRHGRE